MLTRNKTEFDQTWEHGHKYWQFPSYAVGRFTGLHTIYKEYKMPPGESEKSLQDRLLGMYKNKKKWRKAYRETYREIKRLNPEFESVRTDASSEWQVLMGILSRYTVSDIRYWCEDYMNYATISDEYRARINKVNNVLRGAGGSYAPDLGGILPAPDTLREIEKHLNIA